MNLKEAIIGANLRGGLERALLDVVSATVGDQKVIDITSAQILDGHNTPVNVLPPLEAGKYYKDFTLVFEYNFGTTPYIEGGEGVGHAQLSVSDKGLNTEIMTLNQLPLFNGNESIAQVVKMSDITSEVGYAGLPNQNGLDFSLNLSAIDGDGTVTVKVEAVIGSIG